MSKTKRQASAKMFDGPKEKGLFEINAMALEKERNGEKIIHMLPEYTKPEDITVAFYPNHQVEFVLGSTKTAAGRS